MTLILLAAALAGCGRSGGTVEESERFSFDEMATQLAAEEAASLAERED